jgi:hypothetical protein
MDPWSERSTAAGRHNEHVLCSKVTGRSSCTPCLILSGFYQGGNVLGNGTWLNVGGNQAVTFGGNPAASQKGGGPYDDPDGRQSYVICVSHPTVYTMLNQFVIACG